MRGEDARGRRRSNFLSDGLKVRWYIFLVLDLFIGVVAAPAAPPVLPSFWRLLKIAVLRNDIHNRQMHLPIELFAAFSFHLPRIAEEGSDREEVLEAVLLQSLAKATGSSAEQAGVILGFIRRLLQSLSVLDERRLADGMWAFTFFPASLLARSVLGGLGDPDFRLLESGYWDANDLRIDRQRKLIKRSEELRAALTGGLVPIRRVWVAWAWLVLDGKFLMVRRDDPALHRDGNRGQFVFPGGRVSSEDLPQPAYASVSARLDFFDPGREIDADHACHAFAHAMRRELGEELEILSSGIDSLKPACDVIHHNAMEGAKSAFSATEYRIQPFSIALNSTGKTAFLRCLAAHSERFSWFTAEELFAGVNAVKEKAYVDAIHEKGVSLEPESFTVAVGMAAAIHEPIDIPGTGAEPFAIGITGREKQKYLELATDEIDTLGWLAAVRRGEEVSELAAGVSIAYGSGWVLVENDDAFIRLKSLSTKLERTGLTLLDFHERAVRLNAAAPYFGPSLMAMQIQDERRGKLYRLTLERRALQSPLGTSSARAVTTALPEILGNAVYCLAQGEPGPALEHIDTLKRMQREIRGFLDGIGLRLLVRQVDGVPELAVGQHRVV